MFQNVRKRVGGDLVVGKTYDDVHTAWCDEMVRRAKMPRKIYSVRPPKKPRKKSGIILSGMSKAELARALAEY